MPSLPSDEDSFLVKAAKWIKAHGEQYCPITAVRHIPNWKRVQKSLSRKGLIIPYKGGEVIFVTNYGWQYLAAEHEEIISRYKREKKDRDG